MVDYGRCDGCEERFDTAGVNRAHVSSDGLRRFHPECCWLDERECDLVHPGDVAGYAAKGGEDE